MLNITRNIGAILLSLLLHLYFYGSEHIEKFDYEFYDFTTLLSKKIKEQEDSSYTVIVDIDEKSLQQLGQWPWPRVLDAKLIDMVKGMNPSAIGVNILFPERDRGSPVSIQEFYKNFFDLEVKFSQIPNELKDNDKLLSDSVKKSGATLSTYFNNNPYNTSHCQELSYKENMFAQNKTELSATSLLCNHESIQDGVENFGFINAWTDADGMFRRIPLFMNYKGGVFPSFALAMIFSFDQHREIDTDDYTVLVNFSQKEPKVFSAVDLLSGEVSIKEIQGKAVIIGSSVVGLNPIYTTSNGKKVSNSMIHAYVIENILSKTLLTQPKEYKQMNLLLSFLLSVLIIILFSKKFYIHIVTLLLVTSLISLIGLITFYINDIYISIGYLWIPLLYFFAFMLAYHATVINKERQEQEKFLIRQSKLASIGEMISLIAHQWRQPLSAINGIVLNIDVDHRKKILDHAKLDEHLNKIEDTTAYLSKTINDFTDFFSKNKTRDHFYIADIITQTQQLTAIADDKDILVTYKKTENIEVVGYRSELLQSLIIVLNNAIYACKKNLPKTKQGQIIIDTYTLKDNLLISIEDNGGGVDAKDFKKIFDPYFTTKEKPHGTGLGLYIFKLIVEDSMNGKVSVRNGKEGAIFMVQIPINPSEKPKKWGFLKTLLSKK